MKAQDMTITVKTDSPVAASLARLAAAAERNAEATEHIADALAALALMATAERWLGDEATRSVSQAFELAQYVAARRGQI
ncbi:MAG: hypothetical protein ACE5HE_08815 [Phycisphaerae bacterium]